MKRNSRVKAGRFLAPTDAASTSAELPETTIFTDASEAGALINTATDMAHFAQNNSESEADLDVRLAYLRGEANAAQLAGGMSRLSAVVLFVCALIGITASLALIITEKQHLLNPDAALVCDVNPFIGCGEWIGAWQNEVFFGISNSVLGFGAFVALAMAALICLCDGKLPRLLWQLLAIGAGAGLVWLIWFMYQSFFVKSVLCPYCMVVWTVTIPSAYLLISRALQARHFGTRATSLGQFLVRNQGVILTGIYFLVLVTGIFALWDAIFF